MGQSIYINSNAESLLAARVRGATDLRNISFTQFVAGDSLELDLYLVGTEGLLNIQDYAEVRLGMGNLDSRPESGNYLVGGSDTLAYDHTAEELEVVVDSQAAAAKVTKLADFVFKVQFDAAGAQTIPSLDFVNLQPRSTVSVTRLVTGDATTKESWLWRIFRDPLAFTSTFEDIAGSGVRGTLSLATAGIYDLLAQNEEVQTFFEVELTDTIGNVRTFLQAKVKLKGEVIGHNFSGSIPTSPTNSPEANAFLESFPDPTIVGNLTVDGGVTAPNIAHNTDSVIICNQGDDLQAKYDEAYALLPNGLPQSATNRASLVVMGGTYGNLLETVDVPSFVDITGIGNAQISSLRLFHNYGTIDNLSISGDIVLNNNFGIIRNCSCDEFRVEFLNNGTIRNCTCVTFFSFGTGSANNGTIDSVYVSNSFSIKTNNHRLENITTGNSFSCDNNSSDGVIFNVKTDSNIYITNNEGRILNTFCSLGIFISINYGVISEFLADGSTASNVGINLGDISGFISRSATLNVPYNFGVIKNTTASALFPLNENYGLIVDCESFGAASFGSSLGSYNSGTIKNCRAYGSESFGQQDTAGVTDGCTGGTKAFAGTSTQLYFSGGFGIKGTYRNCHGGNNSFFGHNISTDGAKLMEANYYNCTSGLNSFGFVNFTGAETHFAGQAINCTGENNSFSGVVNGAGKILNGGVLENCTGGYGSFAGTNGINEGAVLRCRTPATGAASFKATGTGKVRLCLDGNYDEVNLG